MTDRNLPTPPAQQPSPEDFPELQEATIRLMRDSAAFREMTFQVQPANVQAGAIAAAKTAAAGRPSGPAAVDLTAIWRAAQADTSC